ncbi:putative delta-60 repeat protein [Prosthecobacter fusiformis]|uniref:Putative delta-60 repeat protein n=2 Tax=Prosthecobacter fusiformis TaxID=48464 RepID=A0A4V3FI66_9BACT|nr:putative delta-60 repeat protein [Prosthecobacter fusiformis]
MKFGTVVLGEESPSQEKSVFNSGTEPLSNIQATFSGPEAGAFSIELPPSTPPGTSATLRFKFRPFKVGPHGAKVTLTWDGLTGPAHEYFLGGTGAYGKAANLRFPHRQNWTGTALAELPNGNVLMAGYQPLHVPGNIVSTLRELTPEGTETGRFGSHSSWGKITTLAVQSDGKLIIGGDMNGMQTCFASPLPGNFGTALRPGYLFRFHPDGSFDDTFKSPPSTEYNPQTFITHAIVVLPDGRILVGGEGDYAGHQNLVRLNADGSVDETFLLPAPDGPVYALALQEDGGVIVGGAFTSLDPEAPASMYKGLGRLNADGSPDPAFHNPGFALVSALATASGQLAIAGIRPPESIYGQEPALEWVTPWVTLISPSGSPLLSRFLPAQVAFPSSSPTALREKAPRALSILSSGDVFVIHQPAMAPFQQSLPQVIHLQNPYYGGSYSLTQRQLFDQDVLAIHAQRDGKVLIAGKMRHTLAGNPYDFILNGQLPGIIGLTNIGSATFHQPVLYPLPWIAPASSRPVNGFAQLDIDGLYPRQPIPDALGVQNCSDGLTTLQIHQNLGHVLFAVHPLSAVPQSHLPEVQFTGPDADKFTCTETMVAWTMQWDPNDTTPRPPTVWLVQARHAQPGTLRAIAHISYPGDQSSPSKVFDVALESRAEPGNLARLQVTDQMADTPLPPGSTSYFGLSIDSQNQLPTPQILALKTPTPAPPAGINERTLLLTNTGTEPLSVEFTLDGDHASSFSVSEPLSRVIQPGGTTTVGIHFQANRLGLHQARLGIKDPSIRTWTYDIHLEGFHEATSERLISPLAHIAQSGETVTLEAMTSSEAGFSYQWFYQNRRLPSETSRTLTLAAIRTAQAGSYYVKITSASGTRISGTARVAVIGHESSSLTYVPGKFLRLNQPVAGPTVTYEWLRDGHPLPSSSKGKKSQALTLYPKAADAGTYTCRVTLGNAQRTGVSYGLTPKLPPVPAAAPTLYSWKVGQQVSEQLVFTGEVTQYLASGLPPGIRLNPLTGQLTGTPFRDGTYSITAHAKNAAGTSSIQQIPASVLPLGIYERGRFVGLIDRDTPGTFGRGGPLLLIVSSSGSYTGTLSLYTSPVKRLNHRFTGTLQWSDEDKAVIATTLTGPDGPCAVKITLTDYLGKITLDDKPAGVCRLIITGHHHPTFFHSHFLPVETDPSMMATGYARSSISTSGNVAIAGRLATREGVIPFVSSFPLCDDVSIPFAPVHAWLPKYETFSGWMTIPLGSVIQTQGELGWNADSHQAGEIRFSHRSAIHRTPATGESLLGIDGQDNLLEMTFSTGESQQFMLNSRNQILPGETGTRNWPSPSLGGLLQTASLHPITGQLTAWTWNTKTFNAVTPYANSPLPYGRIDGLTLTPDEPLRGIFTSQDKSRPLTVPIEINVLGTEASAE